MGNPTSAQRCTDSRQAGVVLLADGHPTRDILSCRQPDPADRDAHRRGVPERAPAQASQLPPPPSALGASTPPPPGVQPGRAESAEAASGHRGRGRGAGAPAAPAGPYGRCEGTRNLRGWAG